MPPPIIVVPPPLTRYSSKNPFDKIDESMLDPLNILPEEKKRVIEIMNMPDEQQKETLRALNLEREIRMSAIETDKAQRKQITAMNELENNWRVRSQMAFNFAPQFSRIHSRPLIRPQLNSINQENGRRRVQEKSSYFGNPSQSHSQSFRKGSFSNSVLGDGHSLNAGHQVVRGRIRVEFNNQNYNMVQSINRNIRMGTLKSKLVSNAMGNMDFMGVPRNVESLMESSTIFVNNGAVANMDERLDDLIDYEDEKVQVLLLIDSMAGKKIELEGVADGRLRQEPRGFEAERERGYRDIRRKESVDEYEMSFIVPVKTTQNYITNPPFEVIQQMSAEELSCVENFSIEHPRYGKIEWLEPVDLKFVNFDTHVYIGEGVVKVYPLDSVSPEEKPKIGEALNRPAKITMYKIDPIPSKKFESIEDQLRSSIEKKNGEFIRYDQKEKVLVFRLFHF